MKFKSPIVDYDSLMGYSYHKSKVGIKSRMALGKRYSSPYIQFDSKFDEFIGKHYIPVKVSIEEDVEGKVSVKNKREVFPAIILYFIDDGHLEDVAPLKELKETQEGVQS